MARTISRNEIAFRLTVPLTISPKDLDRAITQEEIHISQVPDLDLSWSQKMAILIYCCGADDKTLRLHACWCARQALAQVKDPNSRSIRAIEVSELFAIGQATEDELDQARQAAWEVAWISTWDTAWAAQAASRPVATAAAMGASAAAARAADAAVRDAVWARQVNDLIVRILAQ